MGDTFQSQLHLESALKGYVKMRSRKFDVKFQTFQLLTILKIFVYETTTSNSSIHRGKVLQINQASSTMSGYDSALSIFRYVSFGRSDNSIHRNVSPRIVATLGLRFTNTESHSPDGHVFRMLPMKESIPYCSLT